MLALTIVTAQVTRGELTLLRITSPSRLLEREMYSSSSCSALSPHESATEVFCVHHPVIALGRPA